MFTSKVVVKAIPAGAEISVPLVWKKVTVRKSLDEICHYMELELAFSERNKIHKHDKVEVRLEGDVINDEGKKSRRLTTVLVDEVSSTVDKAAQGVTVIARSPARDIIDSSWNDAFYRSPTLEQVAQNIAQKFGISVIRMPTNSAATPTLDSFSFENESPWTKLLAAADAEGYILTSNEAGNLYLWKVGRDASIEGFTLIEGENIKDITKIENGAEQFHLYVVKGNFTAEIVTDSTCRNNRVLTIALTGGFLKSEHLKRRGQTEMARRRDDRIKVTISGWGLPDAQIKRLGSTFQKEIFWNPNFLTAVKIPSLNIDATLLVSEVEYVADTTTMQSTLTLVKKEAYA